MKNYIAPFRRTLFPAISLLFFFTLGTGCTGDCTTSWKACRERCPSQEEGEQTVRDCIERCPTGDYQCIEACYNHSREACMSQCSDALERCLDRR